MNQLNIYRNRSRNIFFYSLISIVSDVQLHVRPMFLVKGPRGCGKRELVRIAAAEMGLNFVGVDFAEVQTLTAAQTEAKLRITLHNAQQCIPCILYLNNIQVRRRETRVT